jgi:hypothetical protein
LWALIVHDQDRIGSGAAQLGQEHLNRAGFAGGSNP